MRRNADLLRGGTFDLLVVGGGIYGAWTAYDAALRGLRVALVERGDFASETSSASSKLIHGGLRYLEYREFGLVRKTLDERNRLRQLGPHRVRRMRFAIPLHNSSWWFRTKLRLGLTLYDLMARRNRPLRGHENLSARRLAQRYDFLNPNQLDAGFTYGDCQTDDARFVIEILSGATAAGAVVLNYTPALRLLKEDDTIVGAVVDDLISGGTIPVKARRVALCAGAWNQGLLDANGPQKKVRTRFSKGTHIILPRLPTEDAFLLLTGERGRIVFMIPWNGRTLVGTTDTSYDGDLDAVRCEAEDERYLLRHVNAALRPNARWSSDDIISRFAGLRTFPATDGDSSSLSREWEAVDAAPGVIASVGGKYTSARADAAKLVNKVATELNHEKLASPTTWRELPWRPEGRYRGWQQRSLTRALQCGLDEETAAGCQLRYGEQVEALCELVERLPELSQRYVQDAPYCVGELVFVSQREAVHHLEDVLRRRLPLLLVSRLSRERVAFAAAIVGKVLGWSDSRRDQELRLLCSDWKIEA